MRNKNKIFLIKKTDDEGQSLETIISNIQYIFIFGICVYIYVFICIKRGEPHWFHFMNTTFLLHGTLGK